MKLVLEVLEYSMCGLVLVATAAFLVFIAVMVYAFWREMKTGAFSQELHRLAFNMAWPIIFSLSMFGVLAAIRKLIEYLFEI